jgi:hypothetical protein
MSDDLDSTSEQISSPRRLIWFVAIAGFGCLVASPFRRSAEEANEVGAHPQELASTRFARASDFRGPALVGDAQLPPSLPFVGTKKPSTKEALLAPVPKPLQSRQAASTPAIPATYEPLVKPENRDPAFLADDETGPANVLPQHLRNLSQGQRWPIQARHQESTLEVPPRPYRIRDGDTLESIAERFLGNPNRAAEIFERNRSVLPQPNILPLGQTLLIPQ